MLVVHLTCLVRLMSARRASARRIADSDSSDEDEDDQSRHGREGDSSGEEYEPTPRRDRSRAGSSGGGGGGGGTPQKARESGAGGASGAGIGKDDERRLASDAIFWVLAQERRRAPIKRADVFKAVGLTGRQRDLQDRVWDRMDGLLKTVFGLDLVEPKDKKGSWFLVNRYSLDLSFCAAWKV